MADWPGGAAAGGLRPQPQLRVTHPRPSKRAVEVPDTAPGICRICRGEGTAEEPLFYPCKCSGSIQHVHQDCLMEWLSHSQKKYCELCKTSFRFTKFYSPSMPQSLPISVFFQQVVRYVVQNAFKWLRALVAISFWVCWLPWFTRSGWSTMFWISQESWGASPNPQSSSNGMGGGTAELSSTMLGLDVCPSSPLFSPDRTSVESAETMAAWGSSLSITDFLVRSTAHLFGLTFLWSPIVTSNVSKVLIPEGESLLGNVHFLRALTNNATINKGVIWILEGQIITVVVIVSFILVILVRDYVVQQQPEINAALRAGFEQPADRDPEPEAQAQAQIERDPARAPAEEIGPQVVDDADTSDEEDPSALHHAINTAEPVDMRAHPVAVTLPHAEDHTDLPTEPQMRIEIPSGSGANAEQRDRRYRSVATSAVAGEDAAFGPKSSDGGSSEIEYTPVSTDHSQSDEVEIGDAGKGKGKDKAWPSKLVEPPGVSLESEAGPSRSRSVSDGPQVHRSVNPLANNSWSFTGHGQDPPAVGQTSQDESSQLPFTITSSRRDAGENLTTGYGNQAEPQRPTPVRRYDSIRDRIDANEDVYQPPNEGHVIHIPPPPTPPPAAPPTPSPPPSPLPLERNKSTSTTDYITQATAEFMWGDLTDAEDSGAIDVAAERAHADDDSDDEWVDVPMGEGADGEGEVEAQDAEQDADAGNGLDAEVIDDMEDFEGIMELLGMRGPITNLFQNVIFCAVLVQSALFVCVFGPFNTGRFTIWILAKPMRLVRILFEFSKLLQDVAFIVIGFGSWMIINLIDIFTSWIGGSLATQVYAARKGAWGFFKGAGLRVVDFITLDTTHGTGMQYWSAVSRQGLILIKQRVSSLFFPSTDNLAGFFREKNVWSLLGGLTSSAIGVASRLPRKLLSPDTWVIDFGSDKNIIVNLDLASWNAPDITWAVLAGYAAIFVTAAFYMRSGIRFCRGTMFEDWEAGLIDSLHQASGILKVITIIGIEMLVFPLYCGLLLDCALLPLFAGATFKSRMLFTYNNPWTSVFVHWFVGTGYMFHFALFVSMCRKIMRPGVLYFIRDPDDPEFHPVRDVLERNLTTQLRKILFSAFVYGALVIICLGGVVWGLAFIAPNVLPIHYSSNEPVLEFPVDLLFYTFFMPLAFRLFKPGEGLHAMYKWCFRKSARILRLTYFIFGERRIDEEGTMHLPPDSPYARLPFYRRYMLGLDSSMEQVVPKSWAEILDGVDIRPSASLPQEIQFLRRKKARLVESGQMVPDGTFSRAPASDRVKIPKGRRVFLEVNERDKRLDDSPDTGIYASKQYQMVYIPPHLLPRVFLFIFFIWTFAAVTGVGLTIIPLMFGRRFFKTAIPEHVRTNDIYAFCIGIHVLGAVAYSVYHTYKFFTIEGWLKRPLLGLAYGWAQCRSGLHHVTSGAKLLYAYTFAFVVCPLLLSAMVEFYITIPIHNYMSPPTASSLKIGEETGYSPTQHNVGIIEAWTLGLLYMRLGTRLVNTFMRRTRFAQATRAVFGRGWMEPDIKLLTKAFIVPGLIIAIVALVVPPATFAAAERFLNLIPAGDPANESSWRVRRYRQSYPTAALLFVLLRYGMAMKGRFNMLKVKIRDDAYLMGERLQNYDGSPVETKTIKIGTRARAERH